MWGRGKMGSLGQCNLALNLSAAICLLCGVRQAIELLGLSFVICKMNIMIAPTLLGHCEESME